MNSATHTRRQSKHVNQARGWSKDVNKLIGKETVNKAITIEAAALRLFDG